MLKRCQCHQNGALPLSELLVSPPPTLLLLPLLHIHQTQVQLVCPCACAGAAAEEPGSAALHQGTTSLGHCGRFPLCTAHQGSYHACSQRPHQVTHALYFISPECHAPNPRSVKYSWLCAPAFMIYGLTDGGLMAIKSRLKQQGCSDLL